MFRSFEGLYRAREVDIANIRTFGSESLLRTYHLWDIVADLVEKWLHIAHLLSDPRSWYIVHIGVYGHDLLSFRREMLDLRARKREATILIFWFSEEKYSISFTEFREYHPLIEPDCFSMHAVTVGDDCFNKEFLVPRHLTREELDGTLDDLFFCDIEKRELSQYITLVLVVFRIESDEVRYRLYPRFAELLHVDVSSMQE